jgi:hypothetical protein
MFRAWSIGSIVKKKNMLRTKKLRLSSQRPVIPVNKVLGKYIIIMYNEGAEKEERHTGSLTQLEATYPI